ncbi:MAG: SPOR domain-containing protein [Woeseia sp.]
MAEFMDRPLKERVVGAIVLVVVAVLVVPVFLDGPADDTEVVTETVLLPGQEGQARKQQTIVLNRDRSEPVPAPNVSRDETDSAARDEPEAEARQGAVAVPPETEPAAQQQAAPAVQETEPAPSVPVAAPSGGNAEPAGASDVSATGMWAVQLGSFSNPDNAERLAAELRTKGYAAFLSQLKSNSGPLHRVRIGPQKDRDSAEAVARRLATDGHKGQVLPHP